MTAFVLKLIAMISMLWDHTCKVVLTAEVLTSWGVSAKGVWFLHRVLGALGRPAFPIFAFLIGEGCRHTKNEGKYLLRLLAFGLLSEVPFQLAFHDSLAFRAGNVFFTLALGALACMLCRRLRDWGGAGWQGLALLAGLALTAAAELLHTDYGGLGVLLILVPYLSEKRSTQLVSIALLLTVLYLGKACWTGEGFAWADPQKYDLAYCVRRWLASLLALAPIGLYNGKRGPRVKWLFYVFYPAHILALYGIEQLVKQ